MRLRIVFALGVCAGLMACRDAAPARTELAVFAAASLTDAYRDVEAAFEAAHPGIDVQLTFAGSQTLRVQIEQGAGADVFVSADPSHAEALAAAGRLTDLAPAGRNHLVIITPPDNPAGLKTLADLPRAERLVIGAETVPVGRYTRAMLRGAEASLEAGFAAAVRARVVSEESNVRLVRAKVELGEADAAIVYRTDVTDAARLHTIPIPSALDVPATYVIGTVAARPHGDAVALFRAFIAPDGPGFALMRQHGFAP